MSILVLTPDSEAAHTLCAALTRSGQVAAWVETFAQAAERIQNEPPLVLVVDTEVDEHRALIGDFQQGAPWSRVLVITDDGGEAEGTPLVRKPFDAAALAETLVREQQLAALERSRYALASERLELERGLEHSERLAAIGRIAAGMAHEINNPLAVIRASAAYVAEIAKSLGDTELGASASDIELAVERIGSFVQHVCGFARRERPQMTDAPLQTAVDIALRMVRPRVKGKHVELHVDTCPAVNVPHDPPRLAQAILNLLSNAVDAASGNVWLFPQVTDSAFRIVVEDDGPGLSADLFETVFEPFKTTKPFGQGTGLGLSITRQIANDHGGSVTVTARTGGGARFELDLPRFRASTYRLLVVDHDAAVRRALATDLRREGFDVLSARSYEEARDTLRQTRVHVILCDVELPDQAAAALVPALSRDGRLARIILTSAQPGALNIEGVEHVLAKPWDREALNQAVRRACLRGERRSQWPAPT